MIASENYIYGKDLGQMDHSVGEGYEEAKAKNIGEISETSSWFDDFTLPSRTPCQPGLLPTE
jgi:hypothetical protein